jgi:hypothetical protein
MSKLIYQQQQPGPRLAGTFAVLQTIPGYRDVARVVRDVDHACSMCPTLGGAKAATHTENDGQQRRLLQMDGLVPINYRGATYNIPVHIWVEPDYPSRPVRPYVVPVQGMMIVPGHQHVGADGCCYFPYLNAWNPQTSNIAALVAEIQAAFSAHPPVVSGTEAPAPAPAPVPVPAPAPAYQYQPAPVPAPAPHNRAKDDAAQVVAQQVQARASEQGTALQDELSGLMEQQQVLQAGKQAIDHGLQELRTEKEQLSKRLEWLLDKNTEMTQWLRDNPADELDPDSIVVPKDNQSRQVRTPRPPTHTPMAAWALQPVWVRLTWFNAFSFLNSRPKIMRSTTRSTSWPRPTSGPFNLGDLRLTGH